MNKNNLIIYLSIGGDFYYYQTLFSCFSILSSSKSYSFEIIIHTDNELFFKKFLREFDNIHFNYISNVELIKMRGNIDFIHRCKIETILKSFDEKYEKYIFLDSDTFLMKDVEQLINETNDKTSLMHIFEQEYGEWETARFIPARKLLKLISQKRVFDPIDNLPVQGPISVRNAGVITCVSNDYKFIIGVLNLTDYLYPLIKGHDTEQTAFSYILGKYKILKGCEDVIYHYWNPHKKNIAHQYFSKLFVKEFENLDTNGKFIKIEENKTKLLNDFSINFESNYRNQKYEKQIKTIDYLYSGKIIKGLIHFIFICSTGKASVSYIKDVAHLIKNIKYLIK